MAVFMKEDWVCLALCEEQIEILQIQLWMGTIDIGEPQTIRNVQIEFDKLMKDPHI